MTQAGVTFDDFDNDDLEEVRDHPPFWTVANKKEEELLNWLKSEWEGKKSGLENRIATYQENVDIYKGIHYKDTKSRENAFRDQDEGSSVRTPKVVVNNIYDLVRTKIAKMTRFRPAITVLPRHDEITDKQGALAAKDLIESRWGEVNIDEYITSQKLNSMLYGESLIFIDWDENEGHMVPAQKLAIDSGIEVLIPNKKKSKTIQTEAGDTIKIEEPIFIGDVTYKIVNPDRYILDDAETWNKVNHLIAIDFDYVDNLKAIYPKKQEKINLTKGCGDIRFIGDDNKSNKIMVMTFWHKPTRFLPRGKKIVFTLDLILESGDFPFTDKEGNQLRKLPFERLTDIDIPGELYARSTIRMTMQLQKHHNNITSAIARNHGLASAPKWVVPANAAVTRASLNSDVTIVRYRGPVAPQLVTFNPTPKEIIEYPDKLRVWKEQIWGIHAVSRGEPPNGIRAGIALQFLDEQENERATPEIAKGNRLVVGVAQQTIERMQQYYKNTDGRLVKLLGKDNTFRIKKLDQAILDKPYDIKIQNASALPQSRSSRTQTLIDLNDSFPGMLSNEQVLDLIDLAQDQKFKDINTISVKSSESENESILNGDPLGEPQVFENHIIHWNIHIREAQEREFKEDLPPEGQQTLIEHTLAHEMMMLKKARTNPLYAQKLLMLPNFPVFYEPSPEDIQVLLGGQVPSPGTMPKAKPIGQIGESGMMPAAMPEPVPFTEGKQ